MQSALVRFSKLTPIAHTNAISPIMQIGDSHGNQSKRPLCHESLSERKKHRKAEMPDGWYNRKNLQDFGDIDMVFPSHLFPRRWRGQGHGRPSIEEILITRDKLGFEQLYVPSPPKNQENADAVTSRRRALVASWPRQPKLDIVAAAPTDHCNCKSFKFI